MKRTNLFLALTLASSLAAVACSNTSNQAAQAPAAQETAKQEAPASNTGNQETQPGQLAADIKSGVASMLNVTAELKKQLETGDQAKVKELGEKLEESWASFEDMVKDKYPDLYKKVEDVLDPTIAGTSANPLDKATVGKLNDQLAAALQELAAKEK